MPKTDAMQAPVKPPATEPADITWRDGVPESSRFGDVYFNRYNGLAETRYVFLKQNRLTERFQTLGRGQHFVIAEAGFGTGLNMLAAWAEWLSERPNDDHGILHFVSAERFPLTRTDLKKALALWPELSPLANELIAQYPPLIRGTHRLVLAGGRVRLTLYFGDVLDAWRDLEFRADAWFLDGFSPALNPDMWLDDVITQVYQHSKPGTTLATFTSVSRVQRALSTTGFLVQKAPGFGDKRDMLTAALPPENAANKGEQKLPIAILGAGIAGTLLARNLAGRGWPVLLIDQAEQPGNGASGNPQGALYVKLGVEYNAQTELAASALCFSQRFYHPWRNDFWHPTGLLQIAGTHQEADRQRRFLARNHYPEDLFTPVSSLQASELAGLPVEHSGLWFPGSGWLEPARACRALADHPLIEQHFGFRVARIRNTGDHWQLLNEDGKCLQAGKLVIAAGHQSASVLPATGELRLKPIRGQISCLPEDAFNLPRTVICGTKYLSPAMGGEAVTGATFDLRDNNPEETPQSHRDNLDELLQLLPSVHKPDQHDQIAPEQLAGRVAFRCTTHDYQPVAGPLQNSPGGPAAENLFMFTGLGSKGLAWAPLLAEYLADCLTDQPRTLPDFLAKRVATGRLYRA